MTSILISLFLHLVPARIENWVNLSYGDVLNTTLLSCEASGDEAVNFIWLKNGRLVVGSSNIRLQRVPKHIKSTLTILSTARKDAGDYTCKVFNSFGKDEKNLTLKIRGRKSIDINIHKTYEHT